VKLHKVCNTEKELIPGKERVEVYVTKPSANGGEAAGESGREAKTSNFENCRTTDSRIEEIFIIVKEMRDEMIEK